MSTCNRLDLQTLGSQPIMPKNLPECLHAATDQIWCSNSSTNKSDQMCSNVHSRSNPRTTITNLWSISWHPRRHRHARTLKVRFLSKASSSSSFSSIFFPSPPASIAFNIHHTHELLQSVPYEVLIAVFACLQARVVCSGLWMGHHLLACNFLYIALDWLWAVCGVSLIGFGASCLDL